MAALNVSKTYPYHPRETSRARLSNRRIYKLFHGLNNFTRAYQSWLHPYLRARFHSKRFNPVLSFLYTDLNCNLDCHYCYSRGKKIPGMTMEVAKKAVDWLESQGCKVLAYMGGEPLVRKEFITELTRYAVAKDFFVYLPTNGFLLDRPFVDEIGKAGVAAINLAVDAVEDYDGIPKNFNRLKPQLEYLVQQQKAYGYHTFLNINITAKNVGDVKKLTQIARDYGIATDYHINEPPPITYSTFKHQRDGDWITEKEFQAVEELIDWLIEKNLKGYIMVNSVHHLQTMKRFIRHQLSAWNCSAGQLTLVIRLDGSLAPCFELYGSQDDWGNIYDGPKFDPFKLDRLKQVCSRHCLSTCNYQVYHYTQSLLYSLQWVAKHAYAQFFGTS
jgi:MoaA/NifB/PqqE/SkfB family radical SAM enzyme